MGGFLSTLSHPTTTSTHLTTTTTAHTTSTSSIHTTSTSTHSVTPPVTTSTSTRTTLLTTTAAVLSSLSSSHASSVSSISSAAYVVNATTPASNATTVDQMILVLAMDAYSSYSGSSGLKAYGIPFQVLVVPQNGTALPTLNSTTSHGNYGGIVVMNELSYDYGGTEGWQSALSTDQWNQLYNYQVSFGVRMVRINAYPQDTFGKNFTENK
jgi:hypothetical protein